MENFKNLKNLKNKVKFYLEELKSEKIKGYYKYSYSGDLYNEDIHWNVGSAVFAQKIYYTLGINDNEEIKNISDYIKSFIKPNGLIYDDLIYKKSLLRNFLNSIKNKNLNISDFINYNYKIAETRQCYSALLLYDKLPEHIFLDIPLNEKGIIKYLAKLNWQNPWHAGSHFSHLMFFYKLAFIKKIINKDLFNYLTGFSINWINQIQNKIDGAWYKGNPVLQQKINGSMKILTGLIIIDRINIKYPEKLIDTCLMATNDKHACDNFNIILVLNYASKILNRNYRQNEIEKFSLHRLKKYFNHFHEDKGGFSFYPNKTNRYYYGAKITRGLDEPDIHGTVLFLWGISIITQILKIDKEFGFKEFKT